MSSEGTGMPFLGSLMSLVSHGEIRYEGVLSHIDMPNSSISLSNVRCYGTEGRAAGGQEIPGTDQVFQTVVFKGTEIKELVVLQAAPSDTAHLAPYLPPGEAPVAAPGAPPTPWGAPPPPQQPAAPPAFGSNPWGAPAAPQQPQRAAAPPPPPAAKSAPVPAPTVAIAQVGGNGNPAAAAPRPRPVSYAHAAGGPSAPSRGGGRGGGGAPRGGGRGGYQQHPSGGRGGGRGGSRGGHHQPHHHHPSSAPIQTMTVPTEEFDFEEALKRFNKDKVVEESEVAAADPKYKKDNFFDEISCEALERMGSNPGAGERRGRMAAQRRTDVETFGGAARRGRGGGPYAPRGAPRGRTGGRGGRGSTTGRGRDEGASVAQH